jgi:hypothetical protein
MMADYANGVARDLDLGIRFQAVVLRQLVGGTAVGDVAVEAYARRQGVSPDSILAGSGRALSPRAFGEHITAALTSPEYESITAFGIRGLEGVESLDA